MSLCVCSVILSKRIHVAACSPIWTTFRTHMQIHLEMVMGRKKFPCDLGGTCFFLSGQKLTNVGKLPNRLTDQPQMFHTYADSFSNEHRLKKNYPIETQGEMWGVDVVKKSSI